MHAAPAIEQELRRPDRPTAIFATTFFSTLGAIKAIEALNIPLPGEVSLVAFEHSEWMTVFRPYLTAVSQQSEDLASVSWNLLMDRIAGHSHAPKHIKISVGLTIRESAQPASHKAFSAKWPYSQALAMRAELDAIRCDRVAAWSARLLTANGAPMSQQSWQQRDEQFTASERRHSSP